MNNIEISKTDTLRIMFKAKQISLSTREYKFATRTREKCMGCFCEIFISFTQFHNNTIFCSKCQNKVNLKSPVQAHYIKAIKEKQLKLIGYEVKEIMDAINEISIPELE